MDESQSFLITAGGCTLILAVISGVVIAVSQSQLGILIKTAEEEDNKKAGSLLNILKNHKRQILVGLKGLRSFLALIIGSLITLWAIKVSPQQITTLYYAMGITGLIILIFGEILPRCFISPAPEKIALILFPLINISDKIIVPVIKSIEWIFSPVLLCIRPKNNEAGKLSEEEIKRIVEESGEMGVLDEEETEMIQSIFDLGDTIAREVMVPRVDMICADKDSTVMDIIKLMSSSGFSRIPIYEDSIDNILGVVLARDLLYYVAKEKLNTTGFEIARKPPFFVPETKKINDLLRELQRRSTSIAIVVDEYGGTDGLITIEDILEEIVGEITDEHDKETPDFVKIGEDEYMVDAGTIIEDVNDKLNVNVSTQDQETIGGVVYGNLGHIPKQGEKVTLDDQGIEIIVREIQGQRITKLIIKKIPGNQPEE